jgi:GH15 family glucan-1,4-alpha-glucosidase
MAFLDWLLHVLDDTAAPERLQPLYDVTGRSLGVEATIGELAGYAGSRPVRVGNGAARQVQLDVFGPVAELVALLAEREAPLSSAHWRLVAAMVEAVARRWQEPDHGIWEIRAARRHHVHSKTMCWLTVDRAMRISERMLDRQRRDWAALRDAIRDDVLSRGFHERVGAFTSAYGAEELDAAALHVGLSGLVDADDPRFAATVEAIERELRDGPTVYRYLHDDGLPGREGGFHICASWLVDAYLLLGRRDDAWSLFEEIAARVGGTGLLSEQLDPTTGRALGNHPQAYSHIGLIDNALALR